MDADYPILSRSEDRLKRAPFADGIADVLLNAPKEHSLVFGLVGPWGSGKTSVLNMVKERLQNGEDAPVIVDFNPWSYPPGRDLTKLFFDSISRATRKANRSESVKGKLGELADVFVEYANAISPAADALLSVPVSKVTTFIAKARQRKRSKDRNIDPSELKEKIADKLDRLGIRIVVMVDDLDRVDNKSVCSIFQLVAVIADFPRVNYLLAYDRGHVVDALSAVQGGNGDRYLEKIVQVPMMLPEPSPGLLWNVLAEGVNSAVADRPMDAKEAQRLTKELSKMVQLIMGRARSVRDACRLLNVFEMELWKSQGKIAPGDLLGMSALRIFFPEIITWMNARRAILVGASSENSSFHESAEKRDGYLEEIKSCLGDDSPDADIALNIMREMFPSFENACGSRHARVTETDFRFESRIACPDIFDRYFTGLVEGYDFPLEEARRLLESGGADELVAFLLRQDCGVAGTMVQAIFDKAAELSASQQEEVARALIRAGTYSDEADYSFVSPFAQYQNCLERTLRLLGDDRAGKIMCDEVSGLGFRRLCSVSPFIHAQELAFGKMASEEERPDSQLISRDALESIEGLMALSLRDVKPEPIDASFPGFPSLKRIWEEVDPEEYSRKVADGILRDPLGCSIDLCEWMGRYTSTEDTSWSLSDEGVGNTDLNEAAHLIGEVWREDGFWQLSHEWKTKIAALDLCVNRALDSDNALFRASANDDEVADHLASWEARTGRMAEGD